MSHIAKKVKQSEPEESSSEYVPSDESSESDEYEEQEIKVSSKEVEVEESEESEEGSSSSESDVSDNDSRHQKIMKALKDPNEKHFESYERPDLPFDHIVAAKELARYVLKNGCYPDDTEIAYFRCLRNKYISASSLSERQHMRFASIPLWKEYIQLYNYYEYNKIQTHKHDYSVRNIIFMSEGSKSIRK